MISAPSGAAARSIARSTPTRTASKRAPRPYTPGTPLGISRPWANRNHGTPPDGRSPLDRSPRPDVLGDQQQAGVRLVDALVRDHQPRGHGVADVAAHRERRVVLEPDDPGDLERPLADVRRRLRRRQLQVVEAQDRRHRREPLAISAASWKSRSPDPTSARSRASSLMRCDRRRAIGWAASGAPLGRGADERPGPVEGVGRDAEPQVRPEHVGDRHHRLGCDRRERRRQDRSAGNSARTVKPGEHVPRMPSIPRADLLERRLVATGERQDLVAGLRWGFVEAW